jgi:SAM-dependent methyltransferase
MTTTPVKRLNLGCGDQDIKNGYVNVDFRDIPGTTMVDLEKFPWPWPNNTFDEILMFDILEHFSFLNTEKVISEIWRILKPDGFVDIQVPDFEECAKTIIDQFPHLCNSCGFVFEEKLAECRICNQKSVSIREAAMRRLYGGQNYKGNWHNFSFTYETLTEKLDAQGFYKFEKLEQEHQRLNWNFKVRAFKNKNLW